MASRVRESPDWDLNLRSLECATKGQEGRGVEEGMREGIETRISRDNLRWQFSSEVRGQRIGYGLVVGFEHALASPQELERVGYSRSS
jgi:hypothetical protein